MNRVDLVKVKHDKYVGQHVEDLVPNVLEDSLFYEDGELVGFFISDISKYSAKLDKLIGIADAEFRSTRVPKSTMKRSSGLHSEKNEVLQYSTILGSIAPRPHMRRPYPTRSSVHTHKAAKHFIAAMSMAGFECAKVIKLVAPSIYETQVELFKNVHKKWKFGGLWTSTISNYNISADYHTDNANIVGAVNVIIAKRRNSRGGCTTIPDYGATVNSCDNSMLVYPAWRNLHGVTPIIPLSENGYRNTHVFYPLKAFHGLDI